MKTLIARIAFLAIFLPLATLRASPVADSIAQAERLIEAGDTFGAAEAYREILGKIHDLSPQEQLPWLPEAELGLYRIDALSEWNGDGAQNQPILEKLATRGEAAGEVEGALLGALARLHLGYVRLETGASVEEARAMWRPLGCLEGWRVIGPFDNERGSSFLTEYGPEKELRLDATYDGKKRAVSWRPLPAKPLAGNVDLAALFEPNEEALAYALTFAEAKADAEAALRFGSDEGYRIWVNGELVASEDVRRSFGFDQNVVGIRLLKGWNSILLKLAQSTGAWKFSARLTQPNGLPLEGVSEAFPESVSPEDLSTVVNRQSSKAEEASAAEEASQGEGRSPEKNSPAFACEEGSVAALRKRIEQTPADARSHFLLGTLLLKKQAHDAGEHPDTEALKRAIQIDSQPAIYSLNLAQSHKRKTTIAAQKDDNAWRQAMEKASSSGSALADYLLADYYLTTFRNVSKSRQYVDAALRKNPTLESAVLLRGRIKGAMNFPRAVELASEEIWTFQQNTVSARLTQASDLQAKGRIDEAKVLLQGVLSANATHWGARTRLAKLLSTRDDGDEALVLIRSYSKFDPFSTAPHERLARYLEGRDRLEEAARSIDDALTICPEDHALHEKRGRLLLRMGRKKDALLALDRALSLQPNIPDLREYVEFLRATRSTFEEEFRKDLSVTVQSALEKGPSTEGGDAARVLSDLKAIHVNQDGTTKTFAQTAVQILNERGLRMYDTFSTHYASGEQVVEFKKARVWRRDGTTADAKLSRHGGRDRSKGGSYRWATVKLPPLSIGDVVEVEYVREDVAQSFFGDYFGHREIFKQRIPIDEKILALRVPDERSFYFHKRNMDVEPSFERDQGKGTITYVWVKKDLPKLEEEPAMPGLAEVSPVLEISTFEDWDAFNKWYWNLIKKQFEVSPEIRKKVLELTSGMETDLDRLRAIYNFIATEVRYNAWEFGIHGFKPYNAATIFTRRFGDCKDKATLLSVMLGEAGITAYPVLIYANQRRGEEDLTLPMVHHFNHCITFVPPANGREELYLDGTAQFHSAHELPTMDRGAKVLVVEPERGPIQQIPWNEPAELSSSEEAVVTIQPNLDAKMQVRASASGDYAVSLRHSFEIKAQRRTRLEKIFGRRFASASVEDEHFSNLLDLDEPVSFSVSVNVPRFVVEEPEGLAVRAPEDFFGIGSDLARIGSLEERKYPVLLASPRSSSLKTTYIFPDSLKVKSVPPEHEIESRFGRLRVTYEEESPGKLVAHRLIEVTSPRVSIDEYDAFREFAASVHRLKDEKIVLERS